MSTRRIAYKKRHSHTTSAVYAEREHLINVVINLHTSAMGHNQSLITMLNMLRYRTALHPSHHPILWYKPLEQKISPAERMATWESLLVMYSVYPWYARSLYCWITHQEMYNTHLNNIICIALQTSIQIIPNRATHTRIKVNYFVCTDTYGTSVLCLQKQLNYDKRTHSKMQYNWYYWKCGNALVQIHIN